MAFKTNLFNAATRLVSLCTSLTVLGETMLSMALTFFGFASIPRETPWSLGIFQMKLQRGTSQG